MSRLVTRQSARVSRSSASSACGVEPMAIQGELFGIDGQEIPDRGFRGSVAMSVAGITYRQLDYWARKHIIEPSVLGSNGSGSRRLYSDKDIAIMAVAKRLLDVGINLQNVTTAIMFLNQHSLTYLEDLTLLVDGRSAQECRDYVLMQQYLAAGNAVVLLAIGPIVKRVVGLLAAQHASSVDGGEAVSKPRVPKCTRNARRPLVVPLTRQQLLSAEQSTLLDDAEMSVDHAMAPTTADQVLEGLVAQIAEDQQEDSWQLIQETWG